LAERVVIVGASHAGGTAAAELRAAGFAGAITLVGAEPDLPYHRPPLSKAYLTGEKGADSLMLRAPRFYAEQGIATLLGDPVTRLSRDMRRVVLGSGVTLDYDRLILATGAAVRRLTCPGAGLSGVHYLRSRADADAIRHAARAARRVVVIGGGFIGLEIAASLRKGGASVTVIEAAPRLMARVLSPELSAFFAKLHQGHGVDLRLGSGVTALLGATRAELVQLVEGEPIAADLVVVGIGIVPDTALAESSGLAVDNGILVDAGLVASDPAIFAIGDAARFPHPMAQGPIRLESVQNAHDQARCVAHAIIGKPEAYAAVPWFWSDQYEVKLQMAGLSAGADETHVIGDIAAQRFSVLHLKGGQLVGVDSVNRPADHMRARKALAGPPVAAADLPTLFAERPAREGAGLRA
jgi:3-phenylpropionate/trans-cinnamate dioxygenase ferredoxin reductase subunit